MKAYPLPLDRMMIPNTGARPLTGTVMAIGGGLCLDGPVLPEFYHISGGAGGQIVILPTASELPDAGNDVARALEEFGLHCPARVLPIRSRKDASRPEFVAAVRHATGLFMTGGDQNRLTAAVLGTPFHDAMLEMHRRGGIIAGTSAGTAVLSSVMLAMGESGTLPYEGIASFSTGLGLIDTCIFDQHFRQRNRIGRLIYAVTCHPELTGIGVDEDTAAVIQDGMLRVKGAGAVTVVDGSAMTRLPGKPNAANLIPVSGIQLSILTEGGVYDLEKRRVAALEEFGVLSSN